MKVVGSAISPTSRAFTIELGLQGLDGIELNPNMIAVVKINDYTKQDAIVLPVNIIQKDETSNFVYVVVEGGKQKVARRKKITTGMTYKDKAEVVSGISANEKVVTTGYQELNEGQPISF